MSLDLILQLLVILSILMINEIKSLEKILNETEEENVVVEKIKDS